MTISRGDSPNDWLTSKQTEKALAVNSCELMHLRLSGRLHFRKQGNSFLYSNQDIESMRSKHPRNEKG